MIHSPFDKWLEIRYSLYSPLYDIIGSQFNKQRKRSIELAQLKASSKILIPGAGTGLDLKYLKGQMFMTAIDVSNGMLFKLRKRSQKFGVPVEVYTMDARDLKFPDNSFDVVLLHMIIAVIPNSEKAIKEVERVLKPGGTVMLFDKLLPDDSKINLFRKLINPVAIIIASDLNKKLSEILSGTKLEIVLDEPAGWGGLLRLVKLTKPLP